MTIKLGWSDLLIEDVRGVHALLGDWSWLISGPFAVVAGTKFGDWFLERPDGSTHLLDAIEGELRQVASSAQEFRELINTPPMQEEWLLSELVLTLHEQGLIPRAHECYAFTRPLILGGKAVSSNVQLMDLAVWVSLCGQLHQQLRQTGPSPHGASQVSGGRRRTMQ